MTPQQRDEDLMRKVMEGIGDSLEKQGMRIRDLETVLSIVDYLARDGRLGDEEKTRRIHEIVSQTLARPSARAGLVR